MQMVNDIFIKLSFTKGFFYNDVSFMTLNDDTEITHSEMLPDGKVKVYIETPDDF